MKNSKETEATIKEREAEAYGRGVTAGKMEALKYTPEERERYGKWTSTKETPTPVQTTSEETGLAPSYLQSILNYDPATGRLTWINPKGHKDGSDAGSVDSKGHLRMEISGRTYAVASVAWAMHYGKWPASPLDHINQIKTDNRIDNLREATNQQNSFNRPNHKGKRLPKGVSLHKGKYIARITLDGKTVNLGSFDSAETASVAYRNAAKKFHGEFASYE